MMKKVVALIVSLGMLVILEVLTAYVSQAKVLTSTITFSDGLFRNTDWIGMVIYEDGPPVSFESQQDISAGHPNEYRWLQHYYGGPGNIITAHLREEVVYDPKKQGEISSIAFSFDLILFDGGDSEGVAYGNLIFQNGSYYAPNYVLTTRFQWESHSITNLTATNFWLLSGPGPAYPDFSANGSPIQFGYYASNGTAISRPTSTNSGIDNWSVSIQPASHTLIELDQFTAVPQNNQITITWNTLSEIDNAGFNLWRSDTKDGKYTKINPKIIEAEGGATQKVDYSYTDNTAKTGITYHYKLEDIDTRGVNTFHGPVSVTIPLSKPNYYYYPLYWYDMYGMYSKTVWPPVYDMNYSWWQL
jgi:hypothetical protein